MPTVQQFCELKRVNDDLNFRDENMKMKFTTGEIISAGTGKLACSIERLYAIMNFLTGDNLYTHQLPRAFRACGPWVLKQHPWLLELDTASWNRENWKQNLADAELKFGKEHDLLELPDGWEQRDPLQEAVEMMGNKVIAVQT